MVLFEFSRYTLRSITKLHQFPCSVCLKGNQGDAMFDYFNASFITCCYHVMSTPVFSVFSITESKKHFFQYHRDSESKTKNMVLKTCMTNCNKTKMEL